MNLLDRIRSHAVVNRSHSALEWPGGCLSYAGLAAQVESAMQVLWETSAQTVAIDLDNGPAWVAIDIAAMQLGICLVPIPPFFSPAQVRHAVTQSGADLLISDDMTDAGSRVGELLDTTVDSFEIAGQRLFSAAIRAVTSEPLHDLPPEVCKITFTSGTTGEPKGVLLSWTSMQAVVQSLVDATALQPHDRHLCLMPFAVLLENIGGLYAPLWAGATVAVLPVADTGLTGASGLDAMRMVDALVRTAATTVILTPQSLQGLVDVVASDTVSPLTLRFAAVGGAPVSRRLLQRAAELRLPVYEGYGLSECVSVVSLNTPLANRPGSVGLPLPHVRISIADDGEVWVGGGGFVGYLGHQPMRGEAWPTGDLGEIDANGFLHLRGRLRNVFITAFGRNVAPEWVEGELCVESAIAQAAIFGEAKPFAVAIIVPAARATGADIAVAIRRANKHLPDYARVARWVLADEPFSVANGLLTGTGRLRRSALYGHYADAIESLYCETQAL